jgi:hypothetical protein
MIEVRYKARLGNNLFQYCFGRILAEALGFELRAGQIEGFRGTAEPVRGASATEPEQVLTGQQIDLDAVLSDRRPRRILVDGWFQRHEYYRPHRERIRQWLAFDPGIRAPERAPDLVAHVRRTDYVKIGWALPFSFYEEAFERLLPRGGDVWIVTDDPRDPFFDNFARWRPTFSTGTALEDLRLMTSAKRMVMSQSTFSWWPTFLGDPHEVVCPLPTFGAWSPQGDASDATLIERDRFICIPCTEPAAPTAAENRYQKRRAFHRRVVMALNRRLRLSLPEPAP